MGCLMVYMMIIVGIFAPGILAYSRRCSNCRDCCNSQCVSSEMQVEEQTKGFVRVAELSIGDIIRGVSGAKQDPGWCRVEAVYPTANKNNVTTYDGFTEGHMVVDNNIVHQYGRKGKAKKSRLFTLATECDAAVNAAGQVFTPISTAFCPHDLSWSDYLTVMAAIRRVTDRTGFFWYISDAFHDNKTAQVPFWEDLLYEMCLDLLQCAREGRCQEFENVVAQFVLEHVNEKYAAIVKQEFPNFGGDVENKESGTITEVVRAHRSRTLNFDIFN